MLPPLCLTIDFFFFTALSWYIKDLVSNRKYFFYDQFSVGTSVNPSITTKSKSLIGLTWLRWVYYVEPKNSYRELCSDAWRWELWIWKLTTHIYRLFIENGRLFALCRGRRGRSWRGRRFMLDTKWSAPLRARSLFTHVQSGVDPQEPWCYRPGAAQSNIGSKWASHSHRRHWLRLKASTNRFWILAGSGSDLRLASSQEGTWRGSEVKTERPAPLLKAPDPTCTSPSHLYRWELDPGSCKASAAERWIKQILGVSAEPDRAAASRR